MTNPASADDSALLAAWTDGDRRAGKRLFERYYEPVARFFINKAGDAAADLIQRTFLACLEGLPRFRGDGSFRSYLFAIAYRQLCRHYRDRKGELIDLKTVSCYALDPSLSGLVVEREEIRLFLAALREIPFDLQVVLELHYWEECTVAEMAVVLDIPKGTVKSRMRRAREKLREAVERIAARPVVAMRTLQGLDTWARGVRERVRGHAP